MIQISCFHNNTSQEKVINESFSFIAVIYSELLKNQGYNHYNIISIILNPSEKCDFRKSEMGKKTLFIFYKFNVEVFLNIPTEERKEAVLGTIDFIFKLLSKEDGRLSEKALSQIKDEIIEKTWKFEFVYLRRVCKKGKLKAEIILTPQLYFFDYYIQISNDGEINQKYLLYRGKPSNHYFFDIFYKITWLSEKNLKVEGKRSECVFSIFLDTKQLIIEKKENVINTPIFNLFKYDSGPEEFNEYLKSVDPMVINVIDNEIINKRN